MRLLVCLYCSVGGKFFSGMLSLQNRCSGLVDCARTILSQFIWLKNSPLLSVTDKSYAFAQFPLQEEVQKRSMTFLCSLTPKRFSEVTHSGVIRVFHDILKRSTIPQVDSKQNSLSNLRGILNALCALEDNGLKYNHPLSVPLPSTDPVKFYRQDYHKYLPKFPRRCAIELGWHTNKFFLPRLPPTVFSYFFIQVVSCILVHPILVDTIYHVVGADEAGVW